MPTPDTDAALSQHLADWLASGGEPSPAVRVALDAWARRWAKAEGHRVGLRYPEDVVLDSLYGVDGGRRVATECMQRQHTPESPIREPLSWLRKHFSFAFRDALRIQRHERPRTQPVGADGERPEEREEEGHDTVAAVASPDGLPRSVHRTLLQLERLIRVADAANGPQLPRLKAQVGAIRGYLQRDLALGPARWRWNKGDAPPTQDAWSRAWQARYYRWLIDSVIPVEDPRPYTDPDEVPDPADKQTHNRFSTHVARFRTFYADAFDATAPLAQARGVFEWTGVEHETLERRSTT